MQAENPEIKSNNEKENLSPVYVYFCKFVFDYLPYKIKSLLTYSKSGATYSSNVPLRIMVPEGVNWSSSSVE